MRLHASAKTTLALAVLAAGMTLAPDSRGQGMENALVRGGNAPDAFLLYTGDVIGYLDPCG